MPSSGSHSPSGFFAGAAFLREQVKTLPALPGVYRMIGADASVLYVGKAKNLKKRVVAYTQQARLPVRLQRMVSRVRALEVTVTRTEAEALLLEASYIQRFLPPFNILLRDDKSYPYILIATDHDFPQLLKHRGGKGRKGFYFGPFASGAAVTETLSLLQRGFMLRSCSDAVFSNRSRPCLQYHIKRCSAPCVGRVDKEAYAGQVSEALDFLRGKSSVLQARLASRMQAASDALDFETAAKIRDRIKMLSAVQLRQDVYLSGSLDADVVALYRRGGRTVVQVFFIRQGRNYGARLFYPEHDKGEKEPEILTAFLAQFYTDKPPPPMVLVDRLPDKATLLAAALSQKAERRVVIAAPQRGDKKRLVDMALKNAKEALARVVSETKEQRRLLQRVAEVFGLSKVPARIEVYDNSHTAGSFAVGAMIAAGAEGFLRKTYRKFNIQHARTDDDFAMMQEVLTRRFRRLLEEDPARASGLWPDLLLIDGGAGQINKVDAVLDALGVRDVALVGIAKGVDRNAGKERFFLPHREPFSLPPEDPVLYYLQRLRDEAHRFAIGTHRARRTKAIATSPLDDLPGVGAKRKKALLHQFGSAKAVASADIEDLMRVEGISQNMAKKIWAYFRTAIES